MDDTLSTKEAAEMLGISPIQVVRLARSGKLIVWEYRFHPQHIELYLMENEEG